MQTTTTIPNTASQQFFLLINSPVKLKLYLLKNIPAAYFSGLKIVSATTNACEVTIPFKWFTKNPFRSTYFACLSMAAELSTGILAMAHVYKRNPAISMLVTSMEGKFYKKAVSLSRFVCQDGLAIEQAIATAIETSQPQMIKAYSVGKNEAGETVAEFWISWSFKRKG